MLRKITSGLCIGAALAIAMNGQYPLTAAMLAAASLLILPSPEESENGQKDTTR